VNEWRAESSVLTEVPQEHKAFIESRDAQMPDLYIDGVAGRRRRTDSYPKHVNQADRRLDWREVITRGVSESGSAHHATWLLDRSIAEANEREYRKEASCLADARHTYKQPKKAPREAGLRSKKILRLRVVNASRVTIPY
jgi:hypothetical protein